MEGMEIVPNHPQWIESVGWGSYSVHPLNSVERTVTVSKHQRQNGETRTYNASLFQASRQGVGCEMNDEEGYMPPHHEEET